MVTIFGLCSHTQKSSDNCVYALAATRKRQVALEHLSALENDKELIIKRYSLLYFFYLL